MKTSILPGLQKSLESILTIKDDLGVSLVEVHLIKRRWTGQNIGDGDAVDEAKQILPSPRVVDLAHDLRLVEGGSIQRGDLILKDILKTKYTRSQLMLEHEPTNVEGFYLVNGRYYKAIHVKEKLLTWSVHVRPQAGS